MVTTQNSRWRRDPNQQQQLQLLGDGEAALHASQPWLLSVRGMSQVTGLPVQHTVFEGSILCGNGEDTDFDWDRLCA